jgi:hypothetical protein
VKKTGNKTRKAHDDFFNQMAASCSREESDRKDFARENEEILASWLEYNASHGKKMRKKSQSERKKQ